MRRALLAALLALAAGGCATTASAPGAWVRLDPPRVLDQLVHSPVSCGPAALGTAILAEGGAPARAVAALGDGAVEHTVAAHGSDRFDPGSGVNPRNLLAWANDWRTELGGAPLAGLFLDRGEGEDDAAFVARVHGVLAHSLARGTAPVVRVRSFVPRWYPLRGAYLWDGLAAHWVCVVGVPRELEPGALGFPFDYADPDGGAVERAWAGAETQREFVAARGDAESWVWLDGRAFLLVDGPGLSSIGLATQPWFLRTIVTLDHALVPPAVADEAARTTAGGEPGTDEGATGRTGARLQG